MIPVPDPKPISLEGIASYPLKSRKSKVRAKDFAKPWKRGGPFERWVQSLPRILAADDFRKVVDHVVRAVKGKKMVILAMGAGRQAAESIDTYLKNQDNR